MNETEQNLLEVWQNLVDRPVELTYRIYYDPVTGETTHSGTDLVDEPHVVVDRDTYNSFNSYTHIVVNGELVARPKHSVYARTMQKSDGEGYSTLRGRAMFPTDHGPETDSWKLK